MGPLLPPDNHVQLQIIKGIKTISGMGTETLVSQDDVSHVNFVFPCDKNS